MMVTFLSDRFFLQPLVCCRHFQFHTQNQRALGWEQFFFYRPGFIPYLEFSLPKANLRFFFRALLIPSSQYLGDRFVAKDEDLPLSDSFGLVL
jgi:hypothetical protein